MEELPASIFMRVHRSYVINIEKIKAIDAAEVLVDNIKIPLSPAYKSDLMKALGIA
jgi:two-component system LytT family response regulator